MTPTHSDGLAAAKRVQAANADGHQADARDVMAMLTYHLSLTLRTLPEGQRMAEALRFARLVVSNTRESLD